MVANKFCKTSTIYKRIILSNFTKFTIELFHFGGVFLFVILNNFVTNSTVFNENLFRIYIPFRKYLELEGILMSQNIDYSIDFEMPNSVTDFVRFYFNKKDEKLVSRILSENEIEASDDFFVPSDFKIEQKVFLLYLKIFGTLLFLVFATYLIFTITKD